MLNATLVNLTITNFSICFCLGPLLWCPLSEHVCTGAYSRLAAADMHKVWSETRLSSVLQRLHGMWSPAAS